nr:hypothetical protein Iba_scaffold1536CG0280 [Ipomoea batatas]
MCLATNSLNFTLPRKHIPCESLRSWFGRSNDLASLRTSSFGIHPRGKRSRLS